MSTAAATAPTMHEDMQRRAAETMQSIGGQFARHIGAAWFVADSHNRAALVAAFEPMFSRYAILGTSVA